ncbi:MAG: hypothetical protein KKD28_10850 [Chloroflexi bacterium]|nr:hypothetical protein [Chloroflexota bacterium]
MMCRKAGTEPKKVIQISAPDRQAFPVDLRKWSQATAEGCSLMEAMEMEKGSMDVLATQFLLWDNAISDSPENMDDILARMYGLLRKNGVWYLQDLLPVDMPAQWIYQFFPEAWEWVRNHTWNLYTLYNQMRTAGFVVKVNRQVYYQPIHIKTAMDIAKKRTGVLAALPDDDYEMGIDRFQQVLGKQGSDKLVGSEIAVAEVWGQKK